MINKKGDDINAATRSVITIMRETNNHFAAKTIKELAARAERLKKYVLHLADCPFYLEDKKCTCGLDKLLKEHE